MIKMNCIGGGFWMDPCSTYGKISKHIEWEYGSKNNDITFYIDYEIMDGLKDANDGKKKFGWTMESAFIVPGLIDQIIEHEEEIFEVYDAIFTHDQRLLKRSNKYIWLPAYATWITDINIRPKTKLVSMIASYKANTPQHKLRLGMAVMWKDQLDLYGRVFNPIEKKEQGLDDYMFSVAIENGCYETYFTEKITDCFATGTIPVYMGAPDIGDYFNSDGIITLGGPDFDLKTLTPELYHSKLDAVKDNLERVKEYDVLEDWLWEKELKGRLE